MHKARSPHAAPPAAAGSLRLPITHSHVLGKFRVVAKRARQGAGCTQRPADVTSHILVPTKGDNNCGSGNPLRATLPRVFKQTRLLLPWWWVTPHCFSGITLAEAQASRLRSLSLSHTHTHTHTHALCVAPWSSSLRTTVAVSVSALARVVTDHPLFCFLFILCPLALLFVMTRPEPNGIHSTARSRSPPPGIYCPTVTIFTNDKKQDLDLEALAAHAVRYCIPLRTLPLFEIS
jgi:hypothetical protein